MDRQDLTLVGLTEDEQTLVLVSDAGVEFSLPADARLRDALRGQAATLGRLETHMESALRPRDIQARIRSGESPETVAAAASTSLDRIMVFATPVLAERAHVADRAQRASVRRRAGEGTSRLLADAVSERFAGRDLDPDSVEWDAWRRDDGRWALVADFRSGERSRHAEFTYDVPGRYVVAEDDEARWLVGEPVAAAEAAPSPAPRRLSAVGTVSAPAEPSGQLALGDDVIGLVRLPEPVGQPDAREDRTDEADTEDLSAVVAAVRETAAGDDPEAPQADPAARRAPRRRGRAPVPSWDQIMFGGGSGD